jgi:sigma-B regulation protein RsbU (phosphoserine phosphatase)
VQLPGVVRNLLRLMTQRMRQDNRVIRKTLVNQLRYEHLQKELEMAGKIQTSILPHSVPLLPNHPQVDIAATLEPQREVGGDFFDAFPLDDERVCLIIGDVSGKGMPAAMFMVRVVTLLRMSLTKEAELDLTIEALNQILCQNNEECMFVTLLVGVLEVNTGRLNYVNGGHVPPFVAQQGQPFGLLSMSRGMILGVFEQASFTVDEVILQPGDELVLYTDGVTEAENPQLELFSTDRALEIVRSVPAGGGPVALVKRLEEAVVEYARGWSQSDDITIMALRYVGPGGA